MALTGDTSELDVLMYGGEEKLPEQSSYTLTLQTGVISSSYAGGMDSQEIQFLDSPYNVSCTYEAMDGFEINYLNEFFNRNRGQKFIATLLVGGELEQFVVQRTNDAKPKMTGFNGSISVTYQVVPAVDRCWQQTIFDWGQCMRGPDIAAVWCGCNTGVELWP